ncbi:MAG: hypothetical protein ACT4OU_07390 [Hyphomicrobium sp.]
MLEFSVSGPFPVPMRRPNGPDIDVQRLPELLHYDANFSGRGCYVFSLSVAHGYRPIYVGKTVRATLLKEAFNDSNQLKILRHLNLCNRVDGLFISLVYKCSRGWARNHVEITELEEWLIANAAVRNPDLINRRSLPKNRWRIRGVHKSAGGKPSAMALEFREMMGMPLPKPVEPPPLPIGHPSNHYSLSGDACEQSFAFDDQRAA